jgi:hypothetical protein
MNRSEVIAVLRAVVESRVVTLPRVVGSAALVLHGVLDSCNDVNLYVTPREWGILSARHATDTHIDHPAGSIVRNTLGSTSPSPAWRTTSRCGPLSSRPARKGKPQWVFRPASRRWRIYWKPTR